MELNYTYPQTDLILSTVVVGGCLEKEQAWLSQSTTKSSHVNRSYSWGTLREAAVQVNIIYVDSR